MPPDSYAIEAPNTEGVVLAAEAMELGGRHLDAYLGGESMRERFPGSDVARVVTCRKLRDPEASVGLREAGLGAVTQRGARCDEDL